MDEPQPERSRDASRGSFAKVLGVLVRGPLGCLGFLVGMATVFALALPMLLGKQAPAILRGQLEERFEGRFDVDSVRLGWFERQRLAGFTAATDEGETLFRMDAAAPGLIDLAKTIDGKLGRVEVELSADLVRYADGSWNWQRVFAPRERNASGDEPSGDVNVDTDERFEFGPADVLAEFEFRVPRLSVEDRRPGGPTALLELGDLVAVARIEPGGPSRVEASGRIRGPQESELSLDVDLGLQPHLFGAVPFPFDSLALYVERIPVDWLDAFAGAGGRLSAAVGPTARLTLDATTSADRQRLDGRLELVGDGASLTVALVGRDGRVELADGEPLELLLFDPASLVASLLPAELAESAALEIGDGPWRLLVELLSLPLDVVPTAEGLAAALELAGHVELGAVSAAPAPDGPRVVAATSRVDFSVAPGAGTRVTARANLIGGGTLAASLAADQLSSLEAAYRAGLTPKALLTVDVDSLPTEAIEAFVSDRGLLPALLGRLVSFSASIEPLDAGSGLAFVASGGSDLATFELPGRLVDGQLLSETSDEPLRFALDLTPISSPRVVGPLLPMLAQVRTAPGGDRARFELTDFRLPLDGDPSGLSADLLLDLGQVEATWIPGLEALSGMTDGHLGPYRISIRDGRATYDAVGLSIDGTAIPVFGAVDLTTRGIELTSQVPLAVLGSDLAGLDPAGEVRVPIRLGGAWPAVQFEIDSSSLDASVGDALRARLAGELGESLREQLEGLPAIDGVEEAVDGLLKKGLEGLFGRRKGG